MSASSSSRAHDATVARVSMLALANTLAKLRDWHREHQRAVATGSNALRRRPGGRGLSLGTDDDESTLAYLEREWRRLFRSSASTVRPAALTEKKRMRDADGKSEIDSEQDFSIRRARDVSAEPLAVTPALLHVKSEADHAVAPTAQHSESPAGTRPELLPAAADRLLPVKQLCRAWSQRALSDPALHPFLHRCAATRGAVFTPPPPSSTLGSASQNQREPLPEMWLRRPIKTSLRTANVQRLHSNPSERDISFVVASEVARGSTQERIEPYEELDVGSDDGADDARIVKELLDLTNTSAFLHEPTATIGSSVALQGRTAFSEGKAGFPLAFAAAVVRVKTAPAVAGTAIHEAGGGEDPRASYVERLARRVVIVVPRPT